MPIDRITYTTRASKESDGGYITVYAPDGSYVSRHRDMEECSESAISHAEAGEAEGDLVYRFVPPEKHMTIRRRSIILPANQTTTIGVPVGQGDVSVSGLAADYQVFLDVPLSETHWMLAGSATNDLVPCGRAGVGYGKRYVRLR